MGPIICSYESRFDGSVMARANEVWVEDQSFESVEIEYCVA